MCLFRFPSQRSDHRHRDQMNSSPSTHVATAIKNSADPYSYHHPYSTDPGLHARCLSHPCCTVAQMTIALLLDLVLRFCLEPIEPLRQQNPISTALASTPSAQGCCNQKPSTFAV
ncbi:hypothetical protein ACFX19_041799 [Malus domestica]